VLIPDEAVDAEDAFGSFLVFRKLEQDVDRFDQLVAGLALKLGVDEARAGALVIGRFKDGTPIALSKTETASP